MRVPGLRSLFGSTNETITQTDIVMLLTPHIVRTHELTVDDLAPIYIGTQQNVGLGGPPPLIQSPLPDEPPAAQMPAQPILTPTPQFLPPPAGTAGAGNAARRDDATAGHAAPARCRRPRRFRAPRPARPAQQRRRRAIRRRRRRRRRRMRPRARRRHRSASPRRRSSGSPAVRTPVPLSVSNASRLSTLTLTVTFNPAVLRVRSVQEGTFMRQGGVTAMFTPRIDAATGRVDIAVTRSGDRAGRLGRRPDRRAALRRRRSRQLADSDQRRGEHAGRRGDVAAVHAGVGDGEVDDAHLR